LSAGLIRKLGIQFIAFATGLREAFPTSGGGDHYARRHLTRPNLRNLLLPY
jgi:hypothetical protein